MKRGISKRYQNKKSQFYIIAAVIIIAVFIGIYALTNYAKVGRKQIKIYDLGDELGIETGYVYDYGVYQEEDLNLLIDLWTDKYIDYTKGQEIIEDWIFIYGNENELTASTFSLVTSGTVGLFIGGETKIDINTIAKIKEEHILVKGERKVSVKVPPEDFTYDFELKLGENFFFVITSEEHVAKSK